MAYLQRSGFLSDLVFCCFVYAAVPRITMKDGGEDRGEYCRILTKFGVPYTDVMTDQTELAQEYRGKFQPKAFQFGLTVVHEGRNPFKHQMLERITQSSKYKNLPIPIDMTQRHLEMLQRRAGDFASFVLNAFFEKISEDIDVQDARKFLKKIPKFYREFKGASGGAI